MDGVQPSIAEIWSTVAALLQVLFIGIGGLGALYVYRRTRRGQVSVATSTSVRLIHNWRENRCLLLARLELTNTSNVLYYHREATATLMDARKETRSGEVRLVPFKQADPLPPVYGDIDASSEAVQAGELFRLNPTDVKLEPGERVDTEIAFPIDADKLGLMGLRVLIRGRQRRWLLPKDYWWGSFAYIVPEGERVSLLAALRKEGAE